MLERSGTWRRLLVALACGALLASACSSGDGDGASGGLVSDVAALPAPDEDYDGGFIEVSAFDLDEATEIAGAERPDGLDDGDQLRAWIGPLALDRDRTVHVQFPEPFISGFDPVDQADELGFWIDEVDRFASMTAIPDRVLIVQGGGLGGKVTGDTDDLGDGVRSLGSGDDFDVDPESRTSLRPLGRPLRIRADGDTVVLSVSTDGAREPADGERLIDSYPEVAVAVDRLVQSGAYGVYVLATPDGSQPTIGLGWSDDDGVVLHAVVVSDTFTVADMNERLAGNSAIGDAPWSEVLDVISVEDVDSAVELQARPIDSPPDILLRAILVLDPLFAELE